MLDDSLFTPIFEFLTEIDQTLLLHMAEPLACWQPLDERSPHYDYYRTHPQWHMYNHPEFPSHAELFAARDRVVEQHPDLRIVGAHLASVEYDVDEVATRLERYPNFAVDISARLGDLAMQDSGKVREFFIAYQDRILFGTDVVMQVRPSSLPEDESKETLRLLRDEYEKHFAYFETTDQLSVRDINTNGLYLPQAVLDKVYRENALNWYPVLRNTA
jgi:predicted TIM-barrel fold metal-dependent hydrolase